MRVLVPFALLLTLAGCTPPAQWEKPGVAANMVATDISDCRRGAAKSRGQRPFARSESATAGAIFDSRPCEARTRWLRVVSSCSGPFG